MDLEPDIKADFSTTSDRGEPTSLLEPLIVPSSCPGYGELIDRALVLAQKSASLRSSLPDAIASSLGDLVRSMNCYYSNLIEGHDTHPIDIERALNADFSTDPVKRELQLEAGAHIAIQRWIDQGHLRGRELTIEGLERIHFDFCSLLPAELLWAKSLEGAKKYPVEPGKFRTRDVKVGEHIAVSPGAVTRFMKRFEEAHAGLGKTERILAAASAHHRLVWIHPFLDGNGRVARLMSHAVLLDALQSGGLWSISRGLSRDVERYKQLLAACDVERRNDLDGRGHLSLEALTAFTRFFLDACIDQVSFMEGMMEPRRLRSRIHLWAEEEIRFGSLAPQALPLLDALIFRGELPRGEVAGLVGTGDRQARRILGQLQKHDVIASDSSRAPLRLKFPATLAGRWMPALFPDKSEVK